MSERYCKKCGHKYGKWKRYPLRANRVDRCVCGEPILNWDIRRTLIEIARKMKTITYGEIAEELGIANEAVGNVVGEVSIYECEKERPLLSVVVVRKDTRNSGGGFFGLPCIPKNLQRKEGELRNPILSASESSFWEAELNRVRGWWASHNDPDKP